jgi:hypothetical protein
MSSCLQNLSFCYFRFRRFGGGGCSPADPPTSGLDASEGAVPFLARIQKVFALSSIGLLAVVKEVSVLLYFSRNMRQNIETGHCPDLFKSLHVRHLSLSHLIR